MSKPRAKQKARERKKKPPAIYYSDKPVSLQDWRAGMNSPSPKPVGSDHSSSTEPDPELK